jgi:hypothetical protein
MSGGYASPTQSGLTVLPSPTNYLTYVVAGGSTTQLSWPIDNYPANQFVVALLNQVTASGANAKIQMPLGTNTSTGEKGLFYNPGAFAYTIADSTGATIVSVSPGTVWYLALTNNATAAGTWLPVQFGVGSSAVNAASLAGPGLGATGPLLQQIMAVTTLNTNYSVASTDRDNLLNWTGGAGTFTLPTAASVGSNYYIQVRDSGTGALVLQTQGSDQINGGSSITLNVADSCFVVTDGTNWFTIGLGSIQTNIFNFQVVSLAGQTGTYILPANLQNKVAYRFTGALAGNTNIQVPATIQQYWVDNETTGGFTLGIGTSAQIGGSTQFIITNGARFITYCDASNVLNASTSGLSVPIVIGQGGTGATTASGALTNLGGTSLGIALFEAASVASAQSSLQVLSASDVWAIATGM